MGNSKILILSSEFPPGPGGIGQHAASLAIALSKYHDVLVLCNQDYSDNLEKVSYSMDLTNNIRVFNFIHREHVLAPIRRIIQTFNIIKTHKPTQIIATGRFQLWIAGIVKSVYPKLLVEGFAHGSEVTNNGGIHSKLTYLACARLNKVWAVSGFTAGFLHTQGLNNIGILPNGIDDSLLQINANQVEPFGEWKGNPSLLTVGNITYRKGQHRVIKALPHLLQKYPELHYHIVGLPTKQEEFSQLAQHLGVSDAVTFHGRMASRNELYKAYKSSSIFIMLSENQPGGDVEGFGIALLEANVFSVPTIGALGCGIEDAIGMDSGILVDGDHDESILSAVNIIQNEHTVYQMGARKWAEKHNWGKLVLDIVK
jgi:phosphatidylinositol alpha-1,6-mannosyltransferase